MTRLSEEDFIREAPDSADTVLEACESYHMNGFDDGSSGDVESPTGHFYRAHRFVVVTDNQGFHQLHIFESEEEAEEFFDKLDNQFSEWEDESGD